MPVHKAGHEGPADIGAAQPGGDGAPFVYAGTLTVGGHGYAEVLATGAATRVGRIGASLRAIAGEATPLERQLRRLVRTFGVAALVLSTFLLLWTGLRGGDWLQGLLSAIAVGMSMLPEEFPMALAVFLALGAWRLARIQVLARRPAVIEALGAATVLCVDKTGTLTQNRMELRKLLADGVEVDLASAGALPESAHALLEAAVLASRRGATDPMDRAILARADIGLEGTEHLHPRWLLQREYPLSPALLAMSQAWVAEDGTRHVAAKGAPEAVVDLCHLDDAAAARVLADVARLAGEGLRVLAVARGRAGPGELPGDQHDYAFAFAGLLAFEDPLRPSVPAAVAQAREAGIAVAMITGDHVATALAIARQAGIDTSGGALTGEDLCAMDAAALAQAVRSVRVYARVMPEQKLRLVQALQAAGETVAMTGDGVNDAPALKAAHVGIAMGQRGTDVAREAAGLVLLDEDFGRIVGGVRMGRRIIANLRKVMTYITAIHVPIAGLALLPVVVGWPPLLLPAHVVLTEMIIDPVCSLAFEGTPEDPRTMRRPPRRAQDALLGWPMLWRGLGQGAVLLAVTLAAYALALEPLGADVARTLAVVGLTAGNLLLVWVNAGAGLPAGALGWRDFRAFWIVGAIASAVLAAAILLPGPRALLGFGVPPAAPLLAVLAAVAMAILPLRRSVA